MGEHAVVYGRPAIAAALDLRLTVHLTPLPRAGGDADPSRPPRPRPRRGDHLGRGARLRPCRPGTLGGLRREPRPERFATVRGEDPAHLVKVALGEAAEELGEETPPPGLRLRVLSGLPVGSGFGSSAATATAVVAALRPPARRLLRTRPTCATIERIVFEAERRQHGLPSGIDGATVLHGGLLWARRLPAGGLEIEPVTLALPLLDPPPGLRHGHARRDRPAPWWPPCAPPRPGPRTARAPPRPHRGGDPRLPRRAGARARGSGAHPWS